VLLLNIEVYVIPTDGNSQAHSFVRTRCLIFSNILYRESIDAGDSAVSKIGGSEFGYGRDVSRADFMYLS